MDTDEYTEYAPDVVGWHNQESARDVATERARWAGYLFSKKHYRDVHLWLRRLLVPAHDRPDVAGDVWLAAVTSWQTYDPEISRPERWLNRLTVYVAANYWTRERFRSAFDTEATFDDATRSVYDPEYDVEELVTRLRLIQRTKATLTALDPPMGDIVRGYDLEEQEIRDIARRHERTISTIYKLRTAAHGRLRKLMHTP
jgi:RNA polymerase sigma-70 factor (ECF subfamily)